MTALSEQIKQAIARFRALSVEEQAAHRLAQKQSFVRGEMAMGNDRDEIEFRSERKKAGGDA